NQLVSLNYSHAKVPALQPESELENTLFEQVTMNLGVNFKHTEAKYYDYGSQRGLPQKYSQLGPCITTGDMNDDGLEDFFVGGAANQSGKLFFQQANTGFIARDLVSGLKPEEDAASVLFDADGDKDLDLLVAGGSAEFGRSSKYNSCRLYNNDGKGNFTLNNGWFPGGISVVSQSVAAADYDSDGDTDIFIGGRVTPDRYPEVPRSYLLENNKGVFTDVTRRVSPALENAGMITAALFTDFNNDKKLDLVICGEWMPVRFFENKKGTMVEVTGLKGLTQAKGMWRSLHAVDIDNDGDMDYIAGNMGLNNKYHVTAEQPMMLYAKDVDKNGSVDIIPAYYIRNNEGELELFPGIDRNQLSDAVPAVKKKYLLHKEFADLRIEKFVSDYGKDGWTKLTCEQMQSVWIENLGHGKFATHDLPLQAQVAPINALLSLDVNDDGNTDLVLAGNEYEAEVSTGRYDALYGLVLLGNGKGGFTAVNILKSGFIIDGDVKCLKLLNVGGKGKAIVAGINDDKIGYFLKTAKR
ncbi:MAG TPA: VCBS repeat-containing protein, partial [Segetibacter sp.]